VKVPSWYPRLERVLRDHRGRVGLALGVSLGYAAELLFQPDIFDAYSPGSIAAAAGSIFLECALAGLAMIVTFGWAERHAARRGTLYALQLLAATTAGSFAGVAIWAMLTQQVVSRESAPYLLGEVLRLAVLGLFLALVHGLGQRVRAARMREHEVALEHAALQAETELSQLRLLEAQIEPHFLFNTIANVRRTWRVDEALGRRMHDNAIRYLEASLPRMRAASASLRDEFDLTRAYLELFALRMGPRLRYSIDLQPRLGDQPFPRMALLTLVENSLKHGLMPSDDGGTVTVTAALERGEVVVSVVDDGVGLGGADTAGTGIGLVNIRSRLAAQYGRRARLEIGSSGERGVAARIRIPHAAGEAQTEPVARTAAGAAA
jgi:hypothetical protein